MGFMIVVIIAGGSGTRLWPLSTPERPKHLLNLTGDETLLQASYRRSKALTDKVYVITEAGHAHLVREQLPELPADAFIVEPARRGTANCFVAGMHYIKSKGHDLDEPIAFNSADHYIRDTKGFVRSFRIAEKASRKHKKVTQVGVEPTYPSTGFGYIHKNGTLDSDSVYEVLGFKEKPSFDLAQKYLKTGEYLWNCSYYIGSVNTFERDFEKYAPSLKKNFDALCQTKDEASYEKAYLSFETDTIDFAFSDHVPEKTFLAVPASFDWMDLGSFKDAHDAVETNEVGNYAHGERIATIEVENSFIRNDNSEVPVVVIGLDNVVVVNTPHGLLVARKDLSQKVKEAVQSL